jgi:hypothetical protein
VVGWECKLALAWKEQLLIGETHGECGLLDSGRGDGLDGGGDRAGGLLGGILNVVENVLCGRDCGVAAEREDRGSTHVVYGQREQARAACECVRGRCCCWGDVTTSCVVDQRKRVV